MNIYSQLSKYYELIYYKPDLYETESEVVSSLIESHRQNENRNLLDVACGTGTHIKFFLGRYNVFGLDLSTEMLAIAKQRYPSIKFYQGSMENCHIDERFGSIMCLFGSIGFVQTVENLNTTLRRFSELLESGGVLILTPWSTQEDFTEEIVSDRVKRGKLQIARMEKVERSSPNLVDITYHYLIADDDDIKYFTGHHIPIGLFAHKEYEQAIQNAGLSILELYRGKNIHMGMAFVCRK
jgi:ubiquinone/menaquinone biosynthesis C-methylase UbiE